MASVTINVTGIRDLQSKLDKSVVIKNLIRGVNRASAILEQKTKPLVPVNRYKHGGKLRSALTVIPAELKGSEIVGGIMNPTKYAMFVEYGVGRKAVGTHPNGKDMTYRMTPWVFPLETDKGLKFIKTNGYPARAPMYRGFKESEADIKKQIEEAISASLGRK
nr:MAG TPA: hypothetical protein [Caudoviricetes sp.]DAX99370.1 MAG TPA: hypothetical protein [Caudoviricetes sp.]